METKPSQPKYTETYVGASKIDKQKTEQQENVSQSSKTETQETNEYDPFTYIHNGKKLMFRRTSYDYKLICPTCLKETKQIIQHICKGTCTITVNMDDFKGQLNEYKKAYTKERKREYIKRQRALNEIKVKEDQNKRKKECINRQRAVDVNKVRENQNKHKKESIERQKGLNESKVKESQNRRNKDCMDRQRALNESKVKECQNKRKKYSMDMQRALNESKVKESQNKRKKDCIDKQRAQDESKVKETQNKHSKLSLQKRKAEDHQKLKDNQNTRQEKCRRVINECDRLRDFKNATKYNAMFICTCCHQRMFQSNVQLYSPDLKNDIYEKNPGHTETCIDEEIQTRINGQDKCHIYVKPVSGI